MELGYQRLDIRLRCLRLFCPTAGGFMILAV